MLKYITVLFLLFTFTNSRAQNPIQITISNTTLAATDSVLPFWFSANQNGKINSNGSFRNISELIIGQDYNYSIESNLKYSWGVDLIASFGKSDYFQVNRAFAGFSLSGWELKGGTFYDETRYAGLSATNGILARSQNARPVPKIRLSTMGYKPFFFAQKWFSFKFEYEEGFLTDERYVDGAHLHHKSLYGKIQPSTSWNFKLGLEHYVMWGGTSQNENIGELPEGWNAYWHYVFALPGGDEFPITDQKNISGNQLGTYQFEVEKEFSNMKVSFYLSHPWEDNSGLNWHNWPDNLLGLHINFDNKKSLITDVVYEFSNTRQQSIKDSIYYLDENSGQWKMYEYDDYFNSGIYRSGFTYHQQVMSSPLFFPVVVNNEVSMGIQSNRFFSHHFGARGNFTENLKWIGLLTYIQHSGTYSKPYTTNQKQVSGLFEIQYINPDFPIEIAVATGADASNKMGNNLGFSFSLTKRW